MVHFEIDFWGMPKHESNLRSTLGRFTFRYTDLRAPDVYHDEMLEIEYPSQMHPDYMGVACWAIEHDKRVNWRLR
jgi:hypothetical protein